MVIIGAILFFLLAYKNRKKTLFAFLLSIYALSFTATAVLQGISGSGYQVSIGSFVYLLAILIVLFYPYSGKVDVLSFHSNKVMRMIGVFFAVILIPATFFYGYYGILTFYTVNLTTARIENVTLLPTNVFNTIFSFFSTLYFVPMLLFFVFYKEKKYPTLRKVMLLSTLSFPLLTLCYSGRDGMLFWVMNMVVLYFLFKDGFDDKTKRVVRLVLLYGGIFLAFFFVIISIARFSNNGIGVFYSLIDYMGQQSCHFSTAFDNEFFMGYGTLFPGWKHILGMDDISRDFYDYVSYGYMDEYNVFGFYVKTLVNGYGKIGAFIVAIVIGFFTRYHMSNLVKTHNMIDFLIILTLFQLPMNGVFYYRQGIGNGDVIYTILLLVLLILKMTQKNRLEICK